MAGGGGLKLVVFDFDQTLSCYHVFKALAGWPTSNGKAFGVPAPYATSEKGQLSRIVELDKTGFRAGGFARAAFGGDSRVADVRSLLSGLKDRGAEVIVCTKGLVGVSKKCLKDLELLDYISEVYGNVGDNYGMQPYDRKVESDDLGPEGALLGSAEQSNFGSKGKLIQQLMHKKNLRPEQCILVEDDEEEIRRAKPVCKTLFVEEAHGVTQQHVTSLLRMAGDQPVDVGGAQKSTSWCIVQ